MNKSEIKDKLNKVFEMTSAAGGIVGIENLHDKKVKKKKDHAEDILGHDKV